MNNAQQESPSLSEQAAAWFLRMQEGNCSDAERKAFWSWLTGHPDHYKEYQQYIQLWNQLDQLNPAASQPKRKLSRTGIIAMALLAVMLGMVQWSISREETISTALGQRQHLVLADGTEVDMNGATVLRVAMYGYARKVTLEQGEALFNVAHSALRPFEVYAGSGTLRDIGTAFNVAREEEKTTVAVLEGIVQVNLDNFDSAGITLHGGEQITYTMHGRSAVSATDAKAATAWREGRIIFKETPLPEVIHQINRYHARQIVLSSPGLNDLKVSGEFNTADREGLIRALKILFPLSSEERGQVTTLALMPKGAISR